MGSSPTTPTNPQLKRILSQFHKYCGQFSIFCIIKVVHGLVAELVDAIGSNPMEEIRPSSNLGETTKHIEAANAGGPPPGSICDAT